MSLSANAGSSGPLPLNAADGGSVAPGVRERILTGAYDLFSTRGVRGVGVNELISRSGVAKASFYRHFASKEELAREMAGWLIDHHRV